MRPQSWLNYSTSDRKWINLLIGIILKRFANYNLSINQSLRASSHEQSKLAQFLDAEQFFNQFVITK